MSENGIRRNIPLLKILDEEALQEIHCGTLDVLWKTGLRIEHERALKILEGAGCKVDHDECRVRFPPALVEESVRKCPSTFIMKGRDQRSDITLGGSRVHFKPSPGMNIIDLNTWEPRKATRKEFYEGVKVSDALGSISLFGSYNPYFGFQGVPHVMSMIESFAGKARFSTKPQGEGFSNDCELFTIQMAKSVGVEFYLPCLPAPPLAYYHDSIESGIRGAETGFPVKVGDGSVFGATAPVTLAGALISSNAEVMGPIVLLQTIRPGTRIIASSFSFPTNMKTGAPVFGSVETSLHNVIHNQIWRWYGVPTANMAPGFSSSKRIDFQCGYEKTMGALLSVLSGASIVGLHGGLSAELTYHPVQAVLDDDVAGMIGRFANGVEVNDSSLAVDLINMVGPVPGHFLDKEHTRNWWRKELYLPKSSDRLTYPEWSERGKKSAIDYAKDRMEEILNTYQPSLLSPSQEQSLEEILKEAREFYKKKELITPEEWERYSVDIQSSAYPFG